MITLQNPLGLQIFEQISSTIWIWGCESPLQWLNLGFCLLDLESLSEYANMLIACPCIYFLKSYDLYIVTYPYRSYTLIIASSLWVILVIALTLLLKPKDCHACFTSGFFITFEIKILYCLAISFTDISSWQRTATRELYMDVGVPFNITFCNAVV